MGHVVQTNGDYIIKTGQSGTILLDTGKNVGNVRITGNLIVAGDTLTVSANNLNIKDNIIELNVDDPGPGVTLDYSGIQINRGTIIGSPSPAALIFNESSKTWLFGFGNVETESFNYNESAIRVRYIRTDADTFNGNLILIGTGAGVISVEGTVNYEQQVTETFHIPNKKYVDDAIIEQPSFQIVSDDTRIIIADQNIQSPDENSPTPGSVKFFEDITGNTASTFGRSAINMLVDGELISQFYSDKLLVGKPGSSGIEIGKGPGAQGEENFEIRTESSVSDQNIFIRTEGTGYLRTNRAIRLDHRSTIPAVVSGTTLIHSRPAELGTTGVWFVNDSTNVNQRSGELISKNRALLFSIIF